jgi:hypothetical protein
MSTIAVDDGSTDQPQEPTPASMWQAMAGRPITDGLLEWPPDLFALTDVILERSEAYRFALCPPGDAKWPPGGSAGWSRVVEEAGREWSAWVEDRSGEVPGLLAEEWGVFRERAGMRLEDLAEGEDWRMCESLLTLHAIADEACAGVGVALDRSDAKGCRYRAQGRELLARTGSLARIPSHLLRVLPKVRTPPTGKESFSRYACVQRPGLQTRWYKMPARHPGTDLRAEHANLLLLPWPLRVRESDFRPVDGSVKRLSKEPFGLFEFAPAEGLDLDLVDRMLVAARDEVDGVDGVALPESAVDEREINDLEALLDRHGVIYLQTGVRQRFGQGGRLPSNWVHIGVNPRLEKGGSLPSDASEEWFHIRQNKHHRWLLDEGQINQYHLGGALHPRISWLEAMEIPRRSVHFVELGEFTLVSLVCEDLARSDDVAEVIRAVGPTIVVSVLLDGPQLSSRWAARYASVLADNPGSGVLTLTSSGMVQRSRPLGQQATPVVALWKDPIRGTREISLDEGAQGVLLTICGDRVTRRSTDGRWPANNAIHYFDVAVHQVRASSTGSGLSDSGAMATKPRPLEADELTILTGWAEAVAEALAYAPEGVADLLADAFAGARWRAALAIPDPSPRLSEALLSMDQAVRAAARTGNTPAFDALLVTTQEAPPGEGGVERLARRVLRSTLERLRVRQAQQSG